MKKVLKFKASWCGPCKILSSTLSKITTDVEIEEVDIEQNPTLTQQYKIRGVPTLVMVEDDVELKRVVGVKTKEELETWINN
jgi:thioredoxin 1